MQLEYNLDVKPREGWKNLRRIFLRFALFTFAQVVCMRSAYAKEVTIPLECKQIRFHDFKSKDWKEVTFAFCLMIGLKKGTRGVKSRNEKMEESRQTDGSRCLVWSSICATGPSFGLIHSE